MIDDSVVFEAREIAASQGMSLGEVVSQLARRGLESTAEVATKDGIPLFRRTAPKARIPLATVLRIEDEE